MTTESIRAHPDFNKLFKLYMDASNIDLGAVLIQDNEKGKEKNHNLRGQKTKRIRKELPNYRKRMLSYSLDDLKI